MRNIIIATLLFTALTAQSQTKWRQIERSLTKWNVPAAYDSIPGQTGYAGKWISLQTLIDTIGIGTGGINGSGVADRVAIWKTTDSLTSNSNLTFTSGNQFNLIGRMTMQATSTAGNWNAFINGGNTTLTGVRNIAIGSNQTLSAITTGESNLALGSVSGFKTTTGSDNVYLGYLSGYENATGSNNMFIGAQSGYSTTGSDNVYVGSNAGRQGGNVTKNTYIGTFAGYNGNNSNNVSIGYYSSFNTSNTGQYNTVIGNAASQNGGGDNSVKIGTLSGFGNTGSNNVFIGFEAGRETSSKGGNIFIGYGAGRNEDIDNSLIIANSTATNNGIYGDFDTNKFGVNVAPSSITRTWDINGELRVRDLTTDNPTRLIGADNDGDINSVTIGSGLSITGSTLNVNSFIDSTIVTQGFGILVNESPLNTFTVRADTSKIATQFDISQLDQSATNEIQTLSTSGAAGNISISAGNTITLNVNDADANPTNELQKIDTFQIFDTNKLRISLQNDAEAAKVVTLPNTIDSTNVTQGYGIIVAESPANTFTVTSDTSKIATLYDVSIVDQSATNELQTISTSGAAGNITLSNGGGTLNLNVNDADSSPTNEIQNITTNGTAGNITISSGSTLTLNVNDADASITNEIQTIDTFQVFDTNKLRISLSSDGEPAKVVTLPTSGGGTGIDSTIVTAGWGIDVTESPLNTFTVKADTAEVATQYDLTLKQDKLFSGTNIKTINSNSLLGSGNVSVGTVTSIATSAPITGGIITGSGTISLNYDNTYMGLDAFNRLYPLYNVATWNANQLRGTSIAAPFTPTTGQVLTYNGSAWSPSTPAASATNLTFTGSASPYTLNSDTGTDVTFAEGTGITLTRSSNQITIASTLTAPQTWGDFTTNIQSWGSTGTFGSGKDVGIGGQPTRDFDVIGDSRLRGAIYNSTNSAGSSGQVLTSNGSSAWSWATPADGSATNELQTISTSGGAGNITLSNGGGTLNLNVNDADASATNELQTLSHSADLISHTMTLSNSGGSLILAEGSGIALTTSGNQVTIASSVPFGSGELALSSDLNLTGITTTPIKVDFGATDAIINNYGTTQVMITYSGSFDPDATGNLKFAIYKNGTNLGYKSELNVWTQGTNDGMAFSKRFKTSSVLNDSFELYVIDTGDNFNSINLKNVVFIVELVY